MNTRPWCPLWPDIEVRLRQHQPNGSLPRAGSNGWIGPVHSPLREDRHPSFSVRADSATDPGAYKDQASGEHGSLANLARRLGLDPRKSRSCGR